MHLQGPTCIAATQTSIIAKQLNFHIAVTVFGIKEAAHINFDMELKKA